MDSQVPAQATTRRSRWIPFWVLQAAELAVAVVFVDISLHVDNGGLLVAGAAAFGLLAVTARGPLGLVRLVGPRLHVHLVEVAGMVVALAPVLSRFRPDIEGIIVAEFGAVGLIRLATLTSTAPLGAKVSSTGPVIEATATATGPTAPTGPTRTAPAPESGSAPGAPGTATARAARRVGRAAGVAATAGRRTVDAHRPEAEEQVRRTIRGAGRLAGRATASRPAPEPAPEPGPPEH